MLPFALWLVEAASSSPAAPARIERHGILDAVRPAVAREARRPVRVRVRTLRVEGRWAFLIAAMLDQAGRPLRFTDASRVDAQRHHKLSRDYVALSSHSGQGWSIVAAAEGPTDAVWVDWPAPYGAPPSVVRP